MNTTLPANTLLNKFFAAMLQTGLSFLRAPAVKMDADAILFSVKSFAAAMLAYYISLRIGLTKPFWAIVTVYVVSQTSAGASLSRGVYRFAGTFIGAVATVAIVPNFVSDPILCSVMLAGWIGLCLFFSVLDRTPRAYAFALAGYTASLIGFPSVLEPGAMFDIASVRVQEISIGIICAVLIHRYVFPKRMTGQFTGKLSATMRDARRLAGEALKGTCRENRSTRSQLSVDLLMLQGLATHLPYDPTSAKPRRQTLHLIHDRLARLLPLTADVEDRLHFLRSGGNKASNELNRLVDTIADWIASTGADDGEAAATQLIARARSIQNHLNIETETSDNRVRANLAGHLAEMIGLLNDCNRLMQSNATSSFSREVALLHGAKQAKGYVYHRDPWIAARAALGAFVGILMGCAFWIWSGWPEGGTAVSVIGVCCTLFGNFDAPVPFVVKYIVGLIYGVVISLVYSFIILPQVTDFAVLVAVLAPPFLLAGSLQARLPTTFMALGITLTIPILSGLGTNYTGDFAASLNQVIALLAAIGFGAISMSLFQTVPSDTAINRLLHISRRDVSRRALGAAPDEARWTSLMVDRTALLQPQQRVSGRGYADILDETMRHLRIGHVVGRLRRVIPQTSDEAGIAIADLLSAIAAYYSNGRQMMPDGFVKLDQRIETLMDMMMKDGSRKTCLQIFDLLIDVRFALGQVNWLRKDHPAHDR